MIEKYIPKNHVSELWYRMKKMVSFESYENAVKEYKSLKKWFEGISMYAAESLEEAGDDLLALQMIGCPHQLRKSLYTTNSIESLFSVARSKTERVKR